jgi:excisionase family DNA binding protein
MPTKKKAPSMLTIPQAAKALKVTRQTVWHQVEVGRIKALKVGHVALIPRDELERYRKTRKPGRPPKS